MKTEGNVGEFHTAVNTEGNVWEFHSAVKIEGLMVDCVTESQ